MGNFRKLNPTVRLMAMRETVRRCEECIAYDSRIFYMVSGEISLSINGKRERLSGGNLVYIPAGVRYKLKGKNFLLATVAFDLTDEYSDEPQISPSTPEEFDEKLIRAAKIPPFDKVMRLDDAYDEREAFEELCRIADSAEGEWEAELSAKLKLILIRLAALTDERALPPAMARSLDEYIRENCHDEISNTEVGAIFGYHPFYVSNKLKEAKGVTLRQYIISHRLKMARRLLEFTDKTVSEIAEETGFTDASYFTKCFRAAFSETPKEFRKKFDKEFI